MRQKKIKQKEVVIPFCEGEAERLLFNFLKHKYWDKQTYFFHPQNLEGIRDLPEFKRKYRQQIRKLSLSGRELSSMRLLFIIDNDLDDSSLIAAFIKKNGHLLQFCEPNLEALFLETKGVSLVQTTSKQIFRAKCKDQFSKHFGCEAHELKERELLSIFPDFKELKSRLTLLANLLRPR